MKFKTKQKEAKALANNLYDFIDELVADNERLMKENKELRFQNESLILENKSLMKTGERYYEAAKLIAIRAEKLKEENIKLKVRLDYLAKKGELKDA